MGKIQHNSYEEVRDWLGQARAVVEELEIEGELRVPAFLKAVELLAAGTLIPSQSEMARAQAATILR